MESVYVIASDAGFVKIGVSRYPAARLGALQCGFPHRLTLFREWDRPKGDARRVERMAHRLLAAHRTPRTEWFSVTPKDAAKTVEKACEVVEAMALAPPVPRRIRYSADTPAEVEAFTGQYPGELAREIRKWNRR